MCEIFQKQNTLGNSHFPFNLGRPEAVNYDARRYPLTFQALDEILVLPWNENYAESHLDYIAFSVIESINRLKKA
jgi:hypothetical protein